MRRLINYLKLARLHQPTGIWLLLLPCLFAIALVSKKLPQPDFNEIINVTILYAAGALVMRSLGCIINDIFDHKFDQQTLRTKSRPLASKAVSFEEALLLMGLLLLIGLFILLQFNNKTIYCGLVAVGLILIYPLTKRITYFPQIFLGATFNFGIFMASFSLINDLDPSAILLYFSCMLWTLLYDTIYGFQDIEDDLRIGLKSTSIVIKKNPHFSLQTICSLLFAAFVLVGVSENFSLHYYLLIAASCILMSNRIRKLKLQNPKKCLKLFKQMPLFGLMFLAAIICG